MNNSPGSPCCRARFFACVLGIIGAVTCAAAPQVVTVCGKDDAPGGLNLQTAIAAGGEIVIRCPAGQQTIEFTRTLDTHGAVSVDGEAKVTLRGPVAGPLFTADTSLRLSRLTVENPVPAANASVAGAGTIILGRAATVELESVTTQDSLAAYIANRFVARNSTFQRNGDPASPASGVAVVNADSIELRNVAFNGNFDHPIAGGSAPAPGQPALSRSVLIEDSVFRNNRSSMLLTDARVVIRRTQFEANGAAPGSPRGAWGCCGGAITFVSADAELSGTSFRGNGSTGFGGAIYALGSRLRITQSVFEDNKARAGGAVMFWGRPPKVNIWSSEQWLDAPRLELRRTQFRRNNATAFGGGLLFGGTVEGDAVLFQSNVSAGAGGAIADWRAAALPEPFNEVLDALVGATLPAQPDRLLLARPILVDNSAGGPGAAIAVGAATVAIGNGLIARNQATTNAGGAVSGAANTKITLSNTTIADNGAGGLTIAAGASALLGNTILLRNAAFNCAPGAPLSDAGQNIQFPGADCGAAAGSRDPGLDDEYAPGLISAARGSGATGLCAADPQVRGVDLFGRPRLERGRCDVGAIEQPLPQTMAAALGLGSGGTGVDRLLWLLFLLVAILFLIGLLWAIWRRRRRSRYIGPTAPPQQA